MRRFFGRLVPKSLAGQFALLLAVTLVAANVVALTLLNSERSRFARDARLGIETERVASLLPVLLSVAPAMRGELAEAASTRFMRLSVDPEPRLAQSGDDRFSQLLLARLRDALEETVPAVAAGARMEAVLRHRSRGERWRGGFERVRFGPRRIGRIESAIPLGDGTWLNAVLRRPPRPPRFVSAAILFALALSLSAVLVAGLLFARRLSRPLRELSAAAERAGAGDRSARVAERGPREVRAAARAFNAMQERIGQFDAERARTVAAVGHDLRTPITSLRIRAEMLDNESREGMVKTLDEMAVMADGLLDYGRSAADGEAFGSVDLAGLLMEICAEGREDAARARYDGPEGLVVRGRPVALRRAFANLVGNARRYAGDCTVSLLERDGWAVVRVEDRGPGIPPEQIAQMLEPFTRLDSSRSAETGGAGLGLAIANTIVRAHGGALTLENRQEENGLMVTVRLPMGSRQGSRSA
ncbi:MAG: ATP-binding protein [Pseudomonadota bacterium]